MISSINGLGGLENIESNVKLLLQEFFRKLDNTKIYSILATISFNNPYKNFNLEIRSILNEALLIHSKSDIETLSNFICVRIRISLAKYWFI